MSLSKRMGEFLARIAVGPSGSRDLSEEQSYEAMNLALSREATDVQIGVFLVAERMKRETLAENQGFYRSLTDASTVVHADCARVIALCDPYDGFNRVPHYAPVVAATLGALGHPTLLHGCLSMPPKDGLSARSVLEAMGLVLGVGGGEGSVTLAAKRLVDHGIAYVDLEDFCPSLAALSTIRAEIAKRPFLATLEKLIVPIRGRDETHVIAGWVHSGYETLITELMASNDFASSLLFKGREGHTDPHPNRETLVMSRLGRSGAKSSAVDPSILGGAAPEDSDADMSVDSVADRYRAVLSGEDTSGSRSVRLSVGTILHHLGAVERVSDGVGLATDTLQSGQAAAVFDQLNHPR